MRIYEFEHMKYVKLGDLLRLFKVCGEMAREGKAYGYQIDDEGQRIAASSAIYHMITEVTKYDDDREKCKSPDDIKKYHKRLYREYLGNNYVISAKDKDGKEAHFRGWCDKVEEGKATPVFSESWLDVQMFEDAAEAYQTAKDIETETDSTLNLCVQSARAAFSGKTAEDRLLNAIFGAITIPVCEGASETVAGR